MAAGTKGQICSIRECKLCRRDMSKWQGAILNHDGTNPRWSGRFACAAGMVCEFKLALANVIQLGKLSFSAFCRLMPGGSGWHVA